MDAKNSVYTAFDKRRVRFSDWIVQHALGFTILFLGMLAASYYLIDKQHQTFVEQINTLHDISSSSVEIAHQWYLFPEDPDTQRSLIANLLQQEQQLLQRLRAASNMVHGLPSAPVAIAQFTPEEQAQLALSRLKQVRQVALDQSGVVTQLGIMSSFHVWLLGAGWLLLLCYLVWGWTRILNDRRVALRFFHSQVDKAQVRSEHLPVPVLRNDEFGDFARYLDSVLHSLMQDLEIEVAQKKLFESALSSSLSYKLLLNQQREVLVVSEGLGELWVLEANALSELLGVDAHLDNLQGEIVNEESLSEKVALVHRIGQQNFELRCLSLSGQASGYLLELVPQASYNELHVLESTLSLMANDVWNAPIRILDETSPYLSFSKKLETLRLQVSHFIAKMAATLEKIDKEYPKVTKLQQLSQGLIAKLSTKETDNSVVLDISEQLVSEVDTSRQDFLMVREQIEQRFELYEAYLQQLVELQAAQSTWVSTVSDGLLETKRAVLNLLGLVNGDPKSASEIEHSVLDLTHDIDAVLAEIVEAKPKHGVLGIEHIKGSESDLMLRLNEVQHQLDRITDLVHPRSN